LTKLNYLELHQAAKKEVQFLLLPIQIQLILLSISLRPLWKVLGYLIFYLITKSSLSFTLFWSFSEFYWILSELFNNFFLMAKVFFRFTIS
jgi:hypothetical protein